MAEELIDKQMFPISVEMKDALGQWATKQDISVAEAIRRAIAAQIGYDYTHKSGAGAPKKYANEEERKKAQRQREKDKRVLVRKLLEERKAAIAQNERREGAAALRNSLPENRK